VVKLDIAVWNGIFVVAEFILVFGIISKNSSRSIFILYELAFLFCLSNGFVNVSLLQLLI